MEGLLRHRANPITRATRGLVILSDWVLSMPLSDFVLFQTLFDSHGTRNDYGS